jgi:hypothetical protein
VGKISKGDEMNMVILVSTGYGNYAVGDWVGYAKINRIDVNALGACVYCSIFTKDENTGRENLYKSIYSNDLEITYGRSE